MSMVNDLILIRMQYNRDKAKQWVGKLCPKPRKRLLDCVKATSGCMPMKSDRTHFQVFLGSTANQCDVDLEKRLNGDNVEDFVDECYTVNTYKKVYVHVIQPMAGLELWQKIGRE
ncbi:hypothetical protein LIER_43111 [Lithospermum erythrorhizon]|uniref:Uncharacterized protein n=1 Tax=Lithospermum erythrorhizon TaxID=34254 RepID=A0AAV3PH99_LITER